MSLSSNASRLRDGIRELERTFVVRKCKSSLRRMKQGLPFACRRLTSRWRVLPDVVIVGAQKAGTTHLFATMYRHPACFGSMNKELQYFTRQHEKPVGWYRSNFAYQRTVEQAGGIAFEATPAYLPSPAALQRMHAVVPEAKIIVLLRDPVARAFSHYQHQKTRQREKRRFREVVEQSLDRLTDAFADEWRADDNPEPLYDYIERGYYALQLERLWQWYDRSQTLVLESQELFADTDATVQRVYDFVGVERYHYPMVRIANQGHYREKMEPAVAELLRAHYRSHDERLADLLGSPLGWMEHPTASTRVA